MKNVLIVLGIATLFVTVFSMPAGALENKFGGYWRTRAYLNRDFTGEENEAKDISQVDTRTRLYYTAILNDNLKLVTKFEFDSTWGGPDELGDIGADGKKFEIKNAYADITRGAVNAKIGIQGVSIGRDFLFSDDFSGANLTYKSDAFDLSFIWIKGWEGGLDNNDEDADYYTIMPTFKMDIASITPYFLWATAEDGQFFDNGDDSVDLFYLGVDVDIDLDAASLWFTGIYNAGKYELRGGNDRDVSAWLLALGGEFNMGDASIHGQAFYSTGDDDAGDDDIKQFVIIDNPDYYWSEIMGLGIFDEQVPTNCPADEISNVWAVNIGAGYKATDKLKFTGDLWYAALAEDHVFDNGEQADELGFEIDLVLTYQLVEGMNLDVVGAYLFAGDAVSDDGDNDSDPYEIGARLSFKL